MKINVKTKKKVIDLINNFDSCLNWSSAYNKNYRKNKINRYKLTHNYDPIFDKILKVNNIKLKISNKYHLTHVSLNPKDNTIYHIPIKRYQSIFTDLWYSSIFHEIAHIKYCRYDDKLSEVIAELSALILYIQFNMCNNEVINRSIKYIFYNLVRKYKELDLDSSKIVLIDTILPHVIKQIKNKIKS